MENKENKGIFYKKDCEDQLVTFVSTFFGALSLFSLSLSLSLSHSWTLREFFGALSHWSKKDKKERRRRKQ